MTFTQLSPIALPGCRYSFAPKEAATSSGPHTGLFTELSITGLPGQRHSFVAKTPVAPETGPHTGLFTGLSVIALPGMRHVFLAKSPFVSPSPFLGGGGGGGVSKRSKRYFEQETWESITNKEAEELQEIIQILCMSRIF